MDPQILSALITGGLAIISGAIGFLVRESLNRAQPFISIIDVGGDYRDSESDVDIPESVVKQVKSSFYIVGLDPIDKLRYVSQALGQAREIESGADDFTRLAERIIKAPETENTIIIQNALSEILSPRFFRRWILRLISDDKVRFSPVNKEGGKKVESYPSSGENGRILFSFPGLSPASLGEDFDKENYLRQKSQPFIDQIEYMDVECLKNSFREFKKLYATDLLIAKDVIPNLQKIVDQSSIWMIQLYVANMGKSPFIINKFANLHVENVHGAKYTEKCELVFLYFNDDGTVKSRDRAPNPLVLESENSARFGFATDIQSEMKGGEELRMAFDKGNAEFEIEFEIEKAGFRKKKTLRTPKTSFKLS